MKKLFVLFTMLLAFGAVQAQGSDNGLIGRAKGAAQQAGCFDGLSPALHGTVTGTVDVVRVACGPAIDGLGHRVYLYAPTPCGPGPGPCIQIIVPVAVVIFGCGNDVSVECLSNTPIEL